MRIVLPLAGRGDGVVLKRKLSFPVSRMWQRRVKRSNSAVARASVSIRMPWFGIARAWPLWSASARVARFNAFSTGTVLRATSGGR